jgi:DNA-binding transcriptional ArsR family regulator
MPQTERPALMDDTEAMPGLDAMSQHAGEAERLLRTLANRHRLMVLCALVDGEQSVSGLNARVPLSQSALSQHLAVMRNEGLVATRRDAQTIYYSVTEGPALHILKVLHDCYCGQSPQTQSDQEHPI